MSQDRELRVHRDWIGLLQPVGLVVSPPALLAAQAFPDKNIAKEQQTLLALLTPPSQQSRRASDTPLLPVEFATLATQVLGWKPNKLVPSAEFPDGLSVVLPEFGETLRPNYAVPAPPEAGQDGAPSWLMLVEELSDGASFDEPPPEEGRRWYASPQVRLERLLRETGIGIGILSNRRQVRLVYAPRGESSGHVTWPLHRLITALDRDMLSAFCMLLGSARLFSLPRDQRLPHILKESRKYQNVVSTKLAGQVLEALNELLRGFQAANEASRGTLLDHTVRQDPDHVYGGLLAVLLRLVFILYAEERGLLSSSPVYVRNYSLSGLFEKLRSDAGRFPDTMDQRYGAYSRLLVLFRMVHDGARRGELRLPPRYGHLFDPDAWGFLEGRPYGLGRVMGAPAPVPKVSDGVLLRVLERLLLLDGDRLSYRALDVEQIGSVYENMMGFRLERATETSIGVGKQHVVIGLESLLAKKGAEREKPLKKEADVELSGRAAEALKAAKSVDDLVAALSRRISPLTPRPVPAGGLYLQPTDERRRSGSHYTPRELTEPIVRTTLRPILEDLGPSPKPEQILALKVCDPAMGSGAFLVETCRQLAEALVNAYDVYGRPTDVPPDEDILLYAQRQVAQHCLYGVDKNPFAVDLGKLSLWLATLARGHAFTFLDHSIRHGDSLVGLSREQIASFHWAPEKQVPIIRAFIDTAVADAMALRAKIPELANSDDVQEKRRLLRDADDALAKVRLLGDAVVASFFSEEEPRAREGARARWDTSTQRWLSGRGSSDEIMALVNDLRSGDRAVPCFHWQIEFAEVFERAGFDAVIGNPPYVGGTLIGGRLGLEYHDYLVDVFQPATGLADLIAFFVRRSFAMLRPGGACGFVTTNTVAQGDTRSTGLEAVIRGGGVVFDATRRYRWPGEAAVVASVFHVLKGKPNSIRLDGQSVDRISSFLLASSAEGAPQALTENAARCYCGAKVWGAGFVFEGKPANGSSSLDDMKRLIQVDPRNRQVIFPYIGGEEFNESPTQQPIRYVIDFARMSEEEARGWPALFALVEERVRPIRATNKQRNYREEWWLHANRAEEVAPYLEEHGRVLALSAVSKHVSLGFVEKGTVVANSMVIICLHGDADFAVLQSRVHEVWARFIGSSMKDDLRYTTPCFDTFPRPASTEDLELIGREYYEVRAAVMVKNNEGLTKTYNRFHDPDETSPDILKLRDLHAAMDRAVLNAYGLTRVRTACEFLLDYEEDDDGDPSGGRRKKPWRYRWTDDVRDEVLARLLELNAQRAKEQAATLSMTSGGPATPSGTKKRGAKKAAKASTAQGALFGKESD
ncbi:Eco57I restriction-modification methylase domain-containing protein [Sorangium sp. So ce341]|uniref:Eco57I restriction-modification methylase domain-containing protein n=1 Tax=Sorangium sp. So ce341 TaxID=3133302 RepID=UPI003F5E4F1E